MSQYTHRAELETIISEQLQKQTGQIPSEKDLSDSVDSLLSFFEILIEADKKLMKADESSNNRDPNNTD